MRTTQYLGALSCALSLGLTLTGAEAAPVVVDVVRDPSDPATVEQQILYAESHALVIGIDAYTDGWPRLSNAVKDAHLVGDALEEQGFAVERLIDPTGEELRAALRQFYAIRGANPEARLFLWFAGHGHTALGEGYLVGADAPPPSDPDFLVEALHMREIGSMARLARAKHALAVFDSCFSGTVFTQQRALPPPAITRAVIEPVRQFITSGDADQLVSDDGTFRHLFVTALRGEADADLNGDGYLTGSELGLYVEDRVTNLTEARQTPRSGKLRDIRFDRGDFVFVLPGRNASGQTTAELHFWEKIKNSVRPREYRAYIEAFPNGAYVPIAEARLEILEDAGVTDETVFAEEPATEAPATLRAVPDATVEPSGAAGPNDTDVVGGATGPAQAAVPERAAPEPPVQEPATQEPSEVARPPLAADSAEERQSPPPAEVPSPDHQTDLAALTDQTDSSALEIAQALVTTEKDALSAALSGYSGVADRLLSATRPLARDDVRVSEARVLSARKDSALLELEVLVRTSFGWTTFVDVFAVSWTSGSVTILGHGASAQRAFTQRG